MLVCSCVARPVLHGDVLIRVLESAALACQVSESVDRHMLYARWSCGNGACYIAALVSW